MNKYQNKDIKTQEFIKKYINKFGEFYDFTKTIYTVSKEKIIVTCPKHGDFNIRANIFMFGQGCKKCGIEKNIKRQKKSKEQFILEANKIHSNFYDYSKVDYVDSKTYIIIICPEHGEFKQIPNNHLQGQICKKCDNKLRTKTQEQYLNECKLIHNNKYDYSKTVYKHSEKNITIICSKHGKFEIRACNHLNGQGCQKCSIEEKTINSYKTNEQYLNECKLIHGNKYNYDKTEYIHSEEKVIITCPNHGDFKQQAYKHIQGNGCPNCAHTISKAELEIIDFIKELGINNIEQSNRKILNGLELDIYLPDYNFAIEYNGNYWHSNEFKEDNHHFQKTNECLNKGITLIHIFEDEWLLKKEIVKSRIRNLLNKIEKDRRIYGRDCFVKEISSDEARKFTERNHLQGFTGAKVHLGLFFKIKNNEGIFQEYLVSYMSFGSLRKNLGQTNNNKYSYELLRFCSVINYSIIGGANKLLKYFEKHYNPNYLISYADRRWSNGNLYKQLNFVQSHISKPNYFYINPQTPLKRENRFNYRKDILISKYGCKEEYTEKYFTTEILGLKRIYDSGNLVFEKEYK